MKQMSIPLFSIRCAAVHASAGPARRAHGRRSLLAAAVAGLLGAGCGPAKIDGEDDDTGGADGAADAAGTDAGGEDGASDGQSPTLSDGDAWCYPHPDGELTVNLWSVTARYADPQGDASVENFYLDGIVVLQSGSERARYALACRDGSCVGSWNEADDLIACANASAYTVEVRVIDEDGNISAPLQLTGRQGTDATGR